MRRLALPLLLIAFGAAPAAAQTTERDPQIAEDEQVLRAASISSDPDALLDYLRKQTLKNDERDRISALIKRLDDKSYQKREKAAADLIAVGVKALPVLRLAAEGATLEMRMRLERCIRELEKDSPALAAGAAVRLVKHKRPHGACGVLLNYLTSAPDESIEEEVIDALAGLGVVGGRPDSVLEPALADPAASKRAAAALVLGRAGSRQQRTLVHLLLDDPHAHVQLRAAQGLLLGRDRSAVPALIGLLAKAPMPIAEQAEDILMELAGKTAPPATLGDEGNARQKCYQAWRAWWQVHETKINLARADLESLGNKNPTVRAREVSKKFIVGLIKPDKDLVRKTSDLPFVIAGLERVENRDAWEMLLAQMPMQEKVKEVRFAVQKVITVDDYAKIAGPEEEQYVNTVRKLPIRVVLGEVYEDGQRRELFALFVRINGARARVIALGIPRNQPGQGKAN